MTHYSKSWTQALKEVYSFSEGATEDTKGDKEAYQKFFNSALKKFGVSSPSELEGSKKKEFYDYVDANWKGDNEKPEPEDKQEDTAPIKGVGKLGIHKHRKGTVLGIKEPRAEETEIEEKWKKGKYTVRDGNTDKVIGTYNSGKEASKAMHKFMDSGKYTDLEVKMEEVETEIEESYWKVSIPDMPPFFVEGGSASNIKMDMRTKLKPDVFKEVTVERVARADMIKKYKSMAKGESTEEVKEEVLLEAGAVQAVDPAKMGQKQAFGSRFSKMTSSIGKAIGDAKKKRERDDVEGQVKKSVELKKKRHDASMKFDPEYAKKHAEKERKEKEAVLKKKESDADKEAKRTRTGKYSSDAIAQKQADDDKFKQDVKDKKAKLQKPSTETEKKESVNPLLDTIKELLSEAKPEFEVKYSSSKRGPIKVTKFMTLGDAKEFLAQVKKEGMNGIISKGGKPVKESHDQMECPKCKGEGCDHCDGKGFHIKEKKMKWQKTGLKNAEDDPVASKGDKWQKTGLKNEETINEADYQLYHRDFSSAMQHAYKHAKKKGFIVDPEHIDQKVAMGPKKPSSGKTNRYILGTNKSKNVHIQVANLDNKKFELNMYIEDTDLEEKWTKADQKKFKPKTDKTSYKDAKQDNEARRAAQRKKLGIGEGAVGSSDQQHNALVATKARMEMKKALKSGKSQSQDWWNKQAKLAGLAKEHLEQPWWKQMVREDSITNPKITEYPAMGSKPDFGKDIKKNAPPKPKKTKTGESK